MALQAHLLSTSNGFLKVATAALLALLLVVLRLPQDTPATALGLNGTNGSESLCSWLGPWQGHWQQQSHLCSLSEEGQQQQQPQVLTGPLAATSPRAAIAATEALLVVGSLLSQQQGRAAEEALFFRADRADNCAL